MRAATFTSTPTFSSSALLVVVVVVVAAVASTASASESASGSGNLWSGTSSFHTGESAKRRQQVANLVRHARRLEQGNGDGEEQDYSFLTDYSLKVIKCINDAGIQDDEQNNGYLQYGAVVFRLCPSKTCNDASGCGKNYADYAVGLNAFLNIFFQEQQDNIQYDDDFDVDDFYSCNQYQGGQNENENGDDNADADGSVYYVGPTCTGAADIGLGLFTDQYCSVPTSVSFQELSNGSKLPYSNGGLVSTSCMSCSQNDGNGNYELRELCSDLYQAAPYQCEKEWPVDHYYYDYITEIYRYGQATMGCNYINGWEGRRKKGTDWGGIFFVTFLLFVSIGGGVWYTIWWRKRKETLEKIDDDSSKDISGDWHQMEDKPDDYSGSGRVAPDDADKPDTQQQTQTQTQQGTFA